MKRLTRREKLQNLLKETYRELYANCTEPVSFDLLIESSPKDEEGRIMIPYDEYFIDEKLYDDIVNRNMKKMRLNTSEKNSFRYSAYLGCGPMTIQEREKKTQRDNET